jgi:glycosyltransferase involved in cell wall biosynthesis
MNNSNERKISFVIACYNSENSLKAVVDEITHLLEKHKQNYEIILVNDGSKDNTIGVIRNLCELNHKIKGINLSRNFGQQNAMLAGFNYASGDLIFYCDDDGQSPTDQYQRFIDKIDEGYDMVWAKYTNQKRGFINGIGASINNRMLKFIFNKPLDLNFGNMWVAKSFILKEAVKCKNPKLYLGGLFLTISINMTNVICEQRNRLIGNTNYSLIKLINIWLNGLTAFSIIPLRIATFIGGLTAFIGFNFMIYLIIVKFLNNNVLVGYSSIMSVLIFIGGMLMLMIGIVGEYIGRIYSNMNGLPQFVIKDKMNIENEK